MGVKLLGGAVSRDVGSRDVGFISSLAVELMSCLPHSDYRCGMDHLRMSLPDFDHSGFTNTDTALLKAQHVLVSALFNGIIQNLGVNFNLSPHQIAVLECLRAPHAQDLLRGVPIDGLGQHMSALEYRAILKYRLMIPLFPADEPCLEAHVNFLIDLLEGRSTLRPVDILVVGWEGGKHSYVDLTGVSPLVGLRDTRFVAGQAALKAESGMVAKHEMACLENQHVFTPFAFYTFGFLDPEAVNFLNRVKRVMHSNITVARTQKIAFRRIGFAIQKGVAVQLVARLPTSLL
ncbi:hypothetical protein R6Q57_018577 [Mikania cordata]